MSCIKYKILKPELWEVTMSMAKRVAIMTTFWGFEKPQHIAPNLILTGPTLRENS